MTEKKYMWIISNINMETSFIIGRYPDDEDYLNDIYSEMLIDAYTNEPSAFKNYLTLLIAYCESKEDYLACASLLKIKKKIK
jgi:hypothetical protein